MKSIVTTVAAAALLASLSTGATSAAADGITLKRSGSTASRTGRLPSSDENDDAGDFGDDDVAQSSGGSDASDNGWSWGGGNDEAPLASDAEPSTRTLVIRSDRRAHRRYQRRHCVESFWNSCGERQRTLWILN